MIITGDYSAKICLKSNLVSKTKWHLTYCRRHRPKHNDVYDGLRLRTVAESNLVKPKSGAKKPGFCNLLSKCDRTCFITSYFETVLEHIAKH